MCLDMWARFEIGYQIHFPLSLPFPQPMCRILVNAKCFEASVTVWGFVKGIWIWCYFLGSEFGFILGCGGGDGGDLVYAASY
ncbi:hypothetical protein C1H46_001486 [Malus baccata]|uniref:Uncharacterized protein n=1 Tax=Malus baccata TaxID=106549 RepID=A0A540NQM3_MALBA|nr:hypothetical protein C1H46_001486 [Malus baccata]